MIDNAPVGIANIQQTIQAFLKTARGSQLSNEIGKIKKIATHIFVHMPAWAEHLSKRVDYEGLKITRKQSNLPYGISVEFERATSHFVVHIKTKGKEATGSYKRVMFPVTLGQEKSIVFAVPHKNKREPDDIEGLQKEVNLHRKAEGCGHVVQARLTWFAKWNPERAFHKKTPAIIYEEMNRGSLEGVVQSSTKLTPTQLKQVFIDAATGVSELHNLNPPIIHEDIKPDNILLHIDADGQVTAKLADLGLSRVNSDGHTDRGTPFYISPEKFLDKQIGDGRLDDIWALGLTYYKLRYGRLPPSLQKTRTMDGLKTVLNSPGIIRGDEPLKSTLNHLIWQMLDPNPIRRPNADQVKTALSILKESFFN